MSDSCRVSVSVPPKRASTPIDNVAPTFSPARGGHGARSSRGVDCILPNSPSTTNSESTRPRRRIADVSPAHENDFCAETMNTVSPLLGSASCAAAATTAAHPARFDAAGPATKSLKLHSGQSRTTGSSRSMPIFATSARERAPTSSHRFSIDVGASSAVRRRHRWLLRTANTPDTL